MSPPHEQSPKTGSSRWEAAWAHWVPRLWELLLKDAHADGSSSPRCQSPCAFLQEGSNELHQCSAAHTHGGVTPAPAWHDEHTLAAASHRSHRAPHQPWCQTWPAHTAPCSRQWWNSLGWSLGSTGDWLCCHPFGVLPLAASEEQRPTWPQLLLSTAGASQLDVDRQIPPQSSWCFTFLLYMPEEVQKPLITAASKQLPGALSKPVAAAV